MPDTLISARFVRTHIPHTHSCPARLSRYTVEFALPTHQHPPNSQHRTDDPVALKEFLSELLERGLKIAAIHHDGVDLPSAQFDLLVKDAARMLAARRICHSLGINTDEERYRFGFSA